MCGLSQPYSFTQPCVTVKVYSFNLLSAMASLGKVILDDEARQKRMAKRVDLCKLLIGIRSNLNSLLHLLNNVLYEGFRDAQSVHYYENRHFENIPHSGVSTPSYPHVCMCTDCHSEGGSLLNLLYYA